MTRAKIGGIVAGFMVVLTGAAYLVAAGRLDGVIRHDVVSRVKRADNLLTQISSLEAFDIMSRAQGLAVDDAVRRAILEPTEREGAGKEAFTRFLGSLGGRAKPDFVAVVDTAGRVVVADSPLPDSEDLKTRFKAVAAAIDRGQVSKDIWDYGKSLVRAGVAPVLGAGGTPIGAVIVAYTINVKEAQKHAGLLGTDVVLVAGNRVVPDVAALADDATKTAALLSLARAALGGGKPDPVELRLGGDTYLANASPLPLNFDNRTAAAVVLASLDDARGQFTLVKVVIIALGLAGLLVALFTMWMTSRLILHQSEDIEAGVAEIINGDAEYTFKPVGADFDGLANSLNVMLARLLGRPEPSDGESLGEAGAPARVLLGDAEGSGARMSQDPDVVALAAEPEADYLRRVYDEYIAARRATGEAIEGVTLESFSAKLRLSEANLRKKYNCKAVRFKVSTRDNQVSLKPVPIV